MLRGIRHYCPTCSKPMTRGDNGIELCESGQDRLHKNALCVRLMKEGIEGRRDEDIVSRIGELTDLAGELGRQDCFALVLAWFETFDAKGKNFQGRYEIRLDYIRASALAGERYGTEWQWEQATLAREIFYLRRAVSHQEFIQAPDIFRCMCLNNLGNRLRVAGRYIEALDWWRRTLEVLPNFGMALCNRAITLTRYAEAFEDPDEKACFWWVAHKEASAALAPTAFYTDVRDEATRRTTKTLKEGIESVLNVKRIAADGVDPLSAQDNGTTEQERNYRHWCLVNCLYLNPLNDLGPYTIASTDSLGLAAHVVPVDASNIFESFFDQMMQEYVSARWLLYEGLTVKLPHFSDKDVFLHATEPHPSLSLAIEKVKAAYRMSYSLFDKTSFFMNAYMELGIPVKRVLFRTLWRDGEKQPIRKQFDLTEIGPFVPCIGSARTSSRRNLTK
jgi:tetratricopeptide (TPR) repeat protein